MITILKFYLMTHLNIDYIDHFDLRYFKEPIHVYLSNPINHPNPRQLTIMQLV